jgi:hypothetical protein
MMAPHGIRAVVLVVLDVVVSVLELVLVSSVTVLVVVVTVLVVVVFRGVVVVVVVDGTMVDEVVEVVVVVDGAPHGVQQLPRAASPPATSQRSAEERRRQRAGPFGKENQQAARSGVPQVESRSQRSTVDRHSRGRTFFWASRRVTDATHSV